MNKILYANILSKVQNFTHQTKLYKYPRRDVKHEGFWLPVIQREFKVLLNRIICGVIQSNIFSRK